MTAPVEAAKVLVVDDEHQIRRALRTNLTVRGYVVMEAATGEAALAVAADASPDVVLLDLGLPGVDGMEVLSSLRRWSTVPVIVLTVRDREADKVAALDAGADDYVTKPFGMDELLARMRAQLRRNSTATRSSPTTVRTDHFVVDLAGGIVIAAGEHVHLTPKEWGIVRTLARHAGRLVPRRQLLHDVWGPSYDDESSYLRVYMAQIRKKLEPDPGRPLYFITEPGIGYRLEGTDEGPERPPS